MTTTTTAAYATTPQQSRACPEGYDLNRGVCQAEPTLTCENYNVAQERVGIDNDGDCILTEYVGAVCLNEDGTEILGHYLPSNTCIDQATKQPVCVS